MSYYSIILISVLIITAVVVLHKKFLKKKGGETVDEFPDYNEKFLANAGDKEVIDLVKVFNPQDKMVLRSILDAEGIETYVKSNNFGELYPMYDLNNFATSVISIFQDKSSDAKSVVEEYLLTLQEDSYKQDADKKLEGNPPEYPDILPELLI